MYNYRHVVVSLDKRERELLLSVDVLPLEIEELLTEIEGETALSELCLPLDLLDELVGCLAFAANHTEDRARQKQLDRLYRRLEELLDAHLAVEEAESGCAGGGADPLAQLLAMLGVPSPTQTMALVCSDWEDPNGAVQINHQLAPSDVKHVDFLANARILLRAVREAGGVKATAAGNLNRAFVGEMLDAVRLHSEYAEALRARNKAINEKDILGLHVVRIVAELGGLLRRTRGVFRVTRKGEELLADDRMGVLYALLFRTYFRKFNLAYGSYGVELPILQYTIAYSLYMVSRLLDGWHVAEGSAPLLISVPALETLRQQGCLNLAELILISRVLDPLLEFGLIERGVHRASRNADETLRYRKTDLYDRFLRFDLSAGVDPTQV